MDTKGEAAVVVVVIVAGSSSSSLQGGSAHALIFSWACWSGIWPRLDARLRRLAGPNWLVGWLVGWFGWLQPKKPKDAPKYMKKSVLGTEKTPGGRAQVLVASFKSKSRPWAPKIYPPFADLFFQKSSEAVFRNITRHFKK